MIENNLYVITGIGQLRNIYGFMEEYEAKNNVLIVLYTERNMAVVKNIQSNIIEGKFEEVYYLKQPLSPLKWTRAKGKEIYRLYEEQIVRMKKQYGITNLFLCNRDNYYYYFKGLTQKHHITLNMLEEGLTTYRLFQEEWEASHKQVSREEIVYELREMKNAFKRFGKAFVRLTCKLLTVIFRRDMIRVTKQFVATISKYRYGIIHSFENYYVCYPEIIKRYRPKEERVYSLQFCHGESEVQFVEDVNEENILFVNQRYGLTYTEHFKVVFTIMYNLGIRKFYIKFHPREDKEALKEIVDMYRPMFPEMQIIIVENADNIPVEDLLISNNIKKMYALTSSSLFYSKLVKPEIESYSIAEEYEECCKLMRIPNKKLAMFRQDYHNIQEIFKPEQPRVNLAGVRFVTDTEYEEGAVLFENERYPLDEMEQYIMIFKVLKEMGHKKVYLKFAAKNDMLLFAQNLEYLKEEVPEIEVVPLYSLTYADTVELIDANNITTLIGMNNPVFLDERLSNKNNLHMLSIAEKMIAYTNGDAMLYSAFEQGYERVKEAGIEQYCSK